MNTNTQTVKWNKIASVTTGGKPYFFNTVSDDYYARRSVVWDRWAKVWVVKGPQTKEDYYGKAYMTFDSVNEAKRYVEAGNAV